jgi:hypothetical protein
VEIDKVAEAIEDISEEDASQISENHARALTAFLEMKSESN